MIFSLLRKYIWVVNLLLLILIAYVSALIFNDKLENKIFTPVEATVVQATVNENDGSGETTLADLTHKKIGRSYYEAILKRSIFGIRYSDISLGIDGSEDGSAPETSLNLELLGTYLDMDGKSIAVIKNLDNEKINGYSDGDIVDVIPNERVKLLGVDNCKALIDRNKSGTEVIVCKRSINLAKSSAGDVSHDRRVSSRSRGEDSERDGIKRLGDDKYLIERTMLDDLLEDPTTILNQARVVPQKDGLRFFGIRPSSIFFKIGLRNGDTVHKINEVELSDVENALGIFGKLKNESEFSIDFTRRGKKYSYAYSVN